MTTARSQHVAVPLPSADGTVHRILVTGGQNAAGTPLASTEIYDVDKGTWSAGGNLAVGRTALYAVPLPISGSRPQGGVFVVGGTNAAGAVPVAPEIYNPVTNTWTTLTGTFFQLNPARREMTVSIAGDRVVIAGGLDGTTIVRTVQVFNSATGFGESPSTLAVPRRGHAATVLADGRILFSGGFATAGAVPALSGAEIFNPAVPGNGGVVAAPMAEARGNHTGSLVDGTRVLVTGGSGTSTGQPFSTSEIYNPALNAWSSSGAMTVPRTGHQATVVGSGWLAVTGGSNAASPLGVDNAESWTPTRNWGGLYGIGTPEPIGGARALHTATAIPQSGEVLIVGGGTPPVANAVRYTPNLPPAAPNPPENTTPLPAPLVFAQAAPVPVQNVAVVATPLSGKVFVRIGKTDEYREFKVGEAIPIGTVLDTTDGRVSLTAAVGGLRQTAWFWGGTFQVLQPAGEGGLVELRLVGKPKCSTKKASAAAKRKAKPRVWGDGKGRFRTRGANSAATVRGTKWLVEERCTGTYTKVARGKVSVRDFAKHKTLLVKAPKSYLAKPPRR